MPNCSLEFSSIDLATSSLTFIRKLFASFLAIRRISWRLTLSTTVSTLSTLPAPPQYGHGLCSVCDMHWRVFLRVISTRPSWVIPSTFDFVLSLASSSLSVASTRSLSAISSMSIKSTTIMPLISLSLSWRAISLAASQLVCVIVSCKLSVPTYLPVFTSIVVRASV